mgnify:CR=1 FL=1
MALPQDGQNANGLTKVTEIPKGKELIFIDPTTNEGGIITLEDLTTQILKNLTSQTFALDQGNMTLLAALNQLNSKSFSSTYSTGDRAQVSLPVKSGGATVMIAYSLGGYGNNGEVTVMTLFRYNYKGTECSMDYIYNRGNITIENSISDNKNTIAFKTQNGDSTRYVKIKTFDI